MVFNPDIVTVYIAPAGRLNGSVHGTVYLGSCRTGHIKTIVPASGSGKRAGPPTVIRGNVIPASNGFSEQITVYFC